MCGARNELGWGMSIELYGAPTGNCLRAAIALEEAGIDYRIRSVDLVRGEHKRAEYLGLNPAGRVPTLVDHSMDGQPLVLTQSNAIILYAADCKPNTILSSTPGRDRARAIERFFFFVTDVIAPNHGAFFLRPKREDVAAGLLEERSMEALRLADDFLSEGAYIGGSRFTIADISALTIVGSLADSIEWSDMPRLRQWYANVSGRPGVIAGLRAFDRAAGAGK